MRIFKTDSFDGVIQKLLTTFESDPYSLTKSEIEKERQLERENEEF